MIDKLHSQQTEAAVFVLSPCSKLVADKPVSGLRPRDVTQLEAYLRRKADDIESIRIIANYRMLRARILAGFL